MSEARPSYDELLDAYQTTRQRLEQVEHTLEALVSGDTDAMVVPSEAGSQVYIREDVEQPYRAIVELMAQGVAICDASGMVLRANRALADMLGRSGDQVVGRPISALVAPESAENLEAMLLAARSGCGGTESEVLLRSGPDGSSIPTFVSVGSLDLNGLATYLVSLTDLSHQKRDEELLAADRLTRSIIEQAVDAIVICDPEGRVLRASREARRLCDGNPLRRRFDDAFPLRRLGPPGGDGSTPLDLDRLLRDVPVRGLEVTLPTRHGQGGGGGGVILLLGAGPIADEANRHFGYVMTLTDITALKHAEERLREQDRRKDEFLAMLAHELRNPLAVVSNAVALLQQPQNAEQAAWVRETLERHVTMFAGIVNDLLDASRLERGKITLRKSPVELARIVEQSERVVHQAITERQLTLLVRIEPRPLVLEADPTRLEQILVNLLSNAAKYSPPGGSIALEAGIETNQVVIAVRDNGIGMPPELLARVFDLFAQADHSLDRSQGGLGIGLTLVRRLTELHGGSVEATSNGPGLGSTFTVRLPAPTSPLEPASPPSSADTISGTSRHGRVLLVDDNRDMARSLGLLLKAEGHAISYAYDGPRALQEAERNRPDVVVLDLGLPGLDGFEVARRLRAAMGSTSPRPLLIALSGYGRPQDRARAQAVGFDHHFTKPVDSGQLARFLQERLQTVSDTGRHDPRGDARAAGPEPPPSTPASEAPPSYRVLLIEDQNALAAIARRVMERGGHVVEVAANGPDALDAARRFRPDVVLCDLFLDGPMDGHEVARALRSDPAFSDIPLIAVTARDGGTIQAQSLAAGFDLHLVKPVDFTELRRYVEQARHR